METLIIEYNNLVALAKYAVIAFGSLSAAYGYLKARGVKFATFEKVAEYRELKEVAGILSKNISHNEFMAIVNVVLEKKQKKDSITVEDVAEVGKMLFDAVTTEEITNN